MQILSGKKITVIGAGVSGLSAAVYLNRLGAHVFLSEKGKIGLSKVEILKRSGIQFEENGHSSRVFDSELVVPSPVLFSPLLHLL